MQRFIQHIKVGLRFLFYSLNKDYYHEKEQMEQREYPSVDGNE